MIKEPSIDDMNQAIAIFDGWEKKKREYVKGGYHRYLWEFEYHQRWDALMPVVIKIGNLRVKSSTSYNSDLMFRIEIVNGYTAIEGATEKIFFNSSVEGSMLMATYKAVYQFITWLNQQATTNGNENV